MSVLEILFDCETHVTTGWCSHWTWAKVRSLVNDSDNTRTYSGQILLLLCEISQNHAVEINRS